MKTIIIYESTHHGNTKKLADAIKARYSEVDVVGYEEASRELLEKYDVIGLASGIAFGKFYNGITEFAENKLPSGKKVFFLYTCGKNSKDFSADIRKTAESKGCKSLGSYGCHGFDTYGPFKLIGGLNKNHPTADEISGAVKFYSGIIG